MLLYLTGSAGSIPMAMMAFYGAWRGWQWPMLGAALFALPFVVLSFGFLGFGGFYSFSAGSERHRWCASSARNGNRRAGAGSDPALARRPFAAADELPRSARDPAGPAAGRR